MDTHSVVSYARLQLGGRTFNASKTMHDLKCPSCKIYAIDNSSTFRSLLTTPIKVVVHAHC